MTAFAECCRIEHEGLPRLLSWLDTQADSGRVVLTAKGRLSEFLQRTVGDAVMQRGQNVYAVEFKVERVWTGNVFLETWSNRSTRKTGWLYTLDADVILFYFLDRSRLVSIPFQRLWKWAFGDGEGKPMMYRYEERMQRAHQQLNDTWGRVVPVDRLLKEVGGKVYDLNDDQE